jgi:hypothetical protein
MGTGKQHVEQADLMGRIRDVIEEDRAVLMRAESILQCARIAIEYQDNDDPRNPYYPDVLADIARMVSAVINNLDSPLLEQRIQQSNFKLDCE